MLEIRNTSTVDEPKGQGAIFLIFLYVHGNCTAVIRFFHESMHGNYPDACKIRPPEISLLQTRNMHGPIIRIISYAFLFFKIDQAAVAKEADLK